MKFGGSNVLESYLRVVDLNLEEIIKVYIKYICF